MKMQVLSEGIELSQNDEFKRILHLLVGSDIASIEGKFKVYMENGEIVLDLSPSSYPRLPAS